MNECEESVKKKNESLMVGRVFGRWTILDGPKQTGKYERKWLCKCSCGTQRWVLERSLKSGGSLSCGCLRTENSREIVAHDLTGKIFGNLTVLEKETKTHSYGGNWWRCRCSCGNIYSTPASLLATGKRTHCGCKQQKNTSMNDISGQKFYRLTALYPTEERDSRGSVIWHCICECGNEIDISYNVLLYTQVKSCGCQKKEHSRKLNSYLTHVGGTSVDILKSDKVPTNNTTGVKGVYLVRGRYMAKIVFQKKQYFLGYYETLEEATEARKLAEVHIKDTVLPHYEWWKAKAGKEPEWGKENPIRIYVEKNSHQELQIVCLPSQKSG